MKIMKEVEDIPQDQLRDYIENRAERITEATQGDSWDDPEEWQIEAVELAHAVVRYFLGA